MDGIYKLDWDCFRDLPDHPQRNKTKRRNADWNSYQNQDIQRLRRHDRFGYDLFLTLWSLFFATLENIAERFANRPRVRSTFLFIITVATALKRKSVSGRSLKILQLFTNTPNQTSGQQDRFLTRRATKLVFLKLEVYLETWKTFKVKRRNKAIAKRGENQNLRLNIPE